MGSKMVFYQLETQESLEEVKMAAIKALTPLGGQIMPYGNGLQIINGKNGVQFGWTADFTSTLNINEIKPGKFDLNCEISWKMNTTTIICLVVGFFVFGILWVIPILYLFVDPTRVYQNSLMMMHSLLKK